MNLEHSEPRAPMRGSEIARWLKSSGINVVSALPLDSFYYSGLGVARTGARTALTGGTGRPLRKPLPPIELDLFAQYHLRLPRTVTSADAAGATLSSGEASGHITVFGMTAGLAF